MVENVIVALIVAGAAALLGYRFVYKKSCGCGCASGARRNSSPSCGCSGDGNVK